MKHIAQSWHVEAGVAGLYPQCLSDRRGVLGEAPGLGRFSRKLG